MWGQEWTGQAPGQWSLATDGDRSARKGPGSRRTLFVLFILESVGSLKICEPNTDRLPSEQRDEPPPCPKLTLGRGTISGCTCEAHMHKDRSRSVGTPCYAGLRL